MQICMLSSYQDHHHHHCTPPPHGRTQANGWAGVRMLAGERHWCTSWRQFPVQVPTLLSTAYRGGDRSEIEECAEADASRMQARLSYVDIASLPSYTGKRLLVRSAAHRRRVTQFQATPVCLHPALWCL